MNEISPDDRDLAIRTILGEEGSDAGRAGVAAVILNRLAAGSYGGSIGDVVLAPNQFEPWAARSAELLAIRRNDPRYVEAGQIFDAVRDGSLPDPTNGATHFYAPVAQAQLGRQAPTWAQGQGLKLGSTLFYAPQGRVERKPDAPQQPDMTAGLEQLGMERQLAETGKQNAGVPNRPPAFLKDAQPVQVGARVPNRPPAFLKDAQPVTPAPAGPGFAARIEEGAGELARIPKEAPKALGEMFREGTEAEFGAGRENVARGVAQMKSGPGGWAGGATSDIVGTLQEASSPFVGLADALLGVGGWTDPAMTGAEVPHVAGIAEHAPSVAGAGVDARAASAGPAAVGEALAEDLRDPRAASTGQQAVGRAVQREAPPPPPDPRAAAQGRAAVGEALAEPPAVTPPASSPVAGFKTANGSSYEVHDGGETTRTKSDHTAQGHDPGDTGLKTKSVRTIYVDPKVASALSAAGLTSPEGTSWRVAIRDGKATLISRRGDKPWGASPESRGIPFSTTPVVGKAPVELWEPADDVPGHEAYRGMHAGNEITEVTPRAAASPVPQRPPAFLPADAKPVEPQLYQSFSGEESSRLAMRMAQENPSLRFPDPVQLYFDGGLTIERAQDIREATRENVRAEENRLLGDRSDAWRKARRMSGSSNEATAKRGDAALTEIEDSLPHELRHRLESIDFLENSDPDTWNGIVDDLDQAGSRTGAVKLASWAVRNIKNDVEKTDPGTLLRLAIAMDSEATRGGDSLKLLRDAFEDRAAMLVRQGGSRTDAEESVRGMMERTRDLVERMRTRGDGAAPGGPQQLALPAPVTITFRGKDYSGATKLGAIQAAHRATGIDLERISNETTPENTAADVDKYWEQRRAQPDEERRPQSVGAAASPTNPASALPDRPTRETVWEQEDRFNRLAKAPWADKSELLNKIDSWPARMRTGAAQERFYRHMEDPSFPLTPEEAADYERYVKPLKREELALWEEAKKTDLEGVDDLDPTYAHRMVKGRNPQFDRSLVGGEDDGPLGGPNRLPQSTSSMKPRVFFAIQDAASGERKVVARGDDGSLRIVEPGQPSYPVGGADLRVGDPLSFDNKVWTLEQARTHEIEANTDLTYYKNAAANTVDNIVRLRQVVRAIHEVERLKSSPEWAAYARRVGERGIPRDWREPKMPLFRGWRVQPRLADVIDDFYGHEQGSLTEKIAKISRWSVGTMFWSPVAHIQNVGTHWFTARGWDNVTPHGMMSLVVDGARAFREVVGRGEKYQQLLREGNGLLYASTSLQKFNEIMLKRLGEDVVRNPARWDPIARTLGVGPSDLVRMWYEGSSRVLWSVSDMFMMQRVLELERKGMSTREAIEEAERHIPNYRAHSEILGSRMAAQAYFNPALTEFSRYHYGQVNSWANIAKDITVGGKDALGHDRRLQAIGNVMATGVMMVFVAPLVNEELKKAFGPKVRLPARGSTTLPGPIVDAAMQAEWAKKTFPKYVRDYYNDDSDLLMTAQNLFSIAPIVRGFAEAYPTNKDWFTGRPIAQPAEASGAVHDLAKGKLKEAAGHAGRVAVQEAEHASERLVQPFSALSRIMQGDKGLVKGLIEQALGLTEPNTAGIAKVRQHEEKDANYRRRHPRGPLEEIGERFLP